MNKEPVDLQKLFIQARDDHRAAMKAAKLRMQLAARSKDAKSRS